MIKIADTLLTDYLPHNMKDNHLKALSYALLIEKKRMLNYIRLLNFNSVIADDVPEELLDHLAVECRALFYDDKLPLQTKKKLVEKTLPSYMRVGTPGIIKQFLELTNELVEVKEWFEYGGDPYHFSIAVTPAESTMVTEEIIADIENKIEKLKNARSVLDVVNIIKEFSIDTDFAIESASFHEIERSLGETDEFRLVEDDAKILIDGQGRILFDNEKIMFSKED